MTARRLVTQFVATLVILATALLTGVAGEYKGPIKLIPTKDGSILYSLNMDAKEIAFVNVAEAKVEKSIPLPGTPNDMCLSKDEKTMYVGYGDYQGKICAIDLATGAVTGEGVVGHTPCGLCVTSDGSTIYACLRHDWKLAKISLPDFKVEIGRAHV